MISGIVLGTFEIVTSVVLFGNNDEDSHQRAGTHLPDILTLYYKVTQHCMLAFHIAIVCDSLEVITVARIYRYIIMYEYTVLIGRSSGTWIADLAPAQSVLLQTTTTGGGRLFEADIKRLRSSRSSPQWAWSVASST